MSTEEFISWFLDLPWGGRLAIHRFGKAESRQLTDSKNWPSKATFTRSHKSFMGINKNAVCLVSIVSESGMTLYLAVSKNKRAVATVDTRLTIISCLQISPDKISEIPLQKSDKRQLKDFSYSPTIVPTGAASQRILRHLLSIDENRLAFEEIGVVLLEVNKVYGGIRDVQRNSLQTSLAIAGFDKEKRPKSVKVGEGETAISEYRLLEDNVIIDDSRSFPGLNFLKSDPTGRVVFSDGSLILDIITANKLPLEKTLGVDLIFINRLFNNCVMVQYKMLEPAGNQGEWEYRLDKQFDIEVGKMTEVNASKADTSDYRLNAEVCFFKFVRRLQALNRTGFLIPLSQLQDGNYSGLIRGNRGGQKIREESEGARFLSHDIFCDLVKRGYIGSRGSHSDWLRMTIEKILESGRSLTLAQLSKSRQEGE